MLTLCFFVLFVLERIDSHCLECSALKRTSLGSVLDCVAPCLEESLLSLAQLRLEEVWKSFTEHTKCVDVWLKNDSEKGP